MQQRPEDSQQLQFARLFPMWQNAGYCEYFSPMSNKRLSKTRSNRPNLSIIRNALVQHRVQLERPMQQIFCMKPFPSHQI
eukprot:scaffold200234_cov18-Prasinocladus_malaysianus.AAC.1